MSETFATLDSLNFDNSYARLPEHFYHKILPEALPGSHLISFNPEVAVLLDLNPCAINPSELAHYFGGHAPLPGSDALAMKYTGHQFGYYNPDLGDGRGLLLGEVVNKQGQRWDLHLKGAGKTRYSRFGDGRAVLRSSIREYLVGEAMQGLGIPTTRALCLVGSEQQVMREGMESCAAVLRVTQCHIRFGHFEYFYYSKQHEDLTRLADYSIERYYPDAKNADNPYLAMYQQIAERTAYMVAMWQAYGFVHGVLNTDNMSILGETFDYGPYTFMDEYRPDFVSNHSDETGRYAFKQQPDIIQWNLTALAEAFLPMVGEDDLKAVLREYSHQFVAYRNQRLSARLGLVTSQAEDAGLIEALLTLFAAQRVDFNRFFRTLCDYQGDRKQLYPFFFHREAFDAWMDQYDVRLADEAASFPIRRQQMRSVNPKYMLRNYMAEEAIREANTGNYVPVNQLLALLRHPGDEHPDMERYAAAPPDWAGGISLTCSS